MNGADETSFNIRSLMIKDLRRDYEKTHQSHADKKRDEFTNHGDKLSMQLLFI